MCVTLSKKFESLKKLYVFLPNNNKFGTHQAPLCLPIINIAWSRKLRGRFKFGKILASSRTQLGHENELYRAKDTPTAQQRRRSIQQ